MLASTAETAIITARMSVTAARWRTVTSLVSPRNRVSLADVEQRAPAND